MTPTPTKKEKLQTIRGRIAASAVDDLDRVIAVTIHTEDDQQLHVDPYGAGEDLFEFVDQQVEITGTLHDDDGQWTVEVRRFRVLDVEEGGEDDPDDEQDED